MKECHQVQQIFKVVGALWPWEGLTETEARDEESEDWDAVEESCKKKNVNQFHYRHGVAQRVPGS